MSLRLRIEHGQDAGKTVRLREPGVYVLGRHPQVSMRILDMKVSKEHCEVHLQEGTRGTTAVLHDLGSTHGCQVNGQPVTQDVVLNPGDELRLGLTILRVLSDGEADAEARPAAGRSADSERMQDAHRPGAEEASTRQVLPPDELVGKELAGYTIEKKVGAGGMGGVYLAEQTSLRRKVALKVLNEKFASDSAFVDQFVNEARAAGALNHPNVVQVYDVGSADGRYFFSMELMPGGSIEDRVREGDLEWAVGLNWFIDAANALIFAKKRGILHRDVKPDNLMIAEDQSAKLCDLGLAKKSEVGDLMAQGIIGTPHFISPEAIRRKTEIDARTDLYSLGCTFYRVFTGQNPFPGQTVKEILLGHLNKPAPRVNDLNRDVPKELDEVIARLMAKDPEERFQGPEELLRVLDKIRTQYNLEAHGIKPASRKPLVIGALAVLFAMGVAGWVLTRPDTVVVPPKTQEAKDEELRLKREGVMTTLVRYAQDAGVRLLALKTEILEGDLKRGENWKRPLWPRLVGELRTAADGWATEVEAWRAAGAQEQDLIVQGYYADEASKLQSIVDEARGAAKEIDEEVTYRRSNEKAYEEGKTAALAEAQAKLKAYGETARNHIDKQAYGDLERALQPAAIQALVDALLDKGVGRLKFLDLKDDLEPLLDQYLPGDDKKQNRGKKWIDDAVRTIERHADLKLNDAKQMLGDAHDLEAYGKAIDLLASYLATLPATMDDDAPRTSATYRRARSAKLQPAIDTLKQARDDLRLAQYAQDRVAFFQFLKAVWAPRRARGLLRQFNLALAEREARKVVAAMQSNDYREQMEEWVAGTAAIRTLFDHLLATYPDGWASTNYEVDEKDKRKKSTIKGVTPRGLTLGRDDTSYADLGPAFLLKEVFFFEGSQPRFAFDAQDQHGLAVLAELAGDYAAASRHLQAAETAYGTDPLVGAIRRRLGHLEAERQAAEKWLALVDWTQGRDEWARHFESLVDTDGFDEEVRSRLLSEGNDWDKQMQARQSMRQELAEDPRLAATAWGSSLRETLHPQVAYAGEPLPKAGAPAPPKPPGEGGNGAGK